MISSVVIPLVAFPLRCATILRPRRRVRRPRALRMRTVVPTTSNSTSLLGSSPSRSRISTGIVTCPFDLMRMPISSAVILFVFLLSQDTVVPGKLGAWYEPELRAMLWCGGDRVALHSSQKAESAMFSARHLEHFKKIFASDHLVKHPGSTWLRVG